MYVCLCYGVTENEIRQAVHEGACSLPELQQCLGVTSGCGKCGECALQVLNQTLGTLPRNAMLNSA